MTNYKNEIEEEVQKLEKQIELQDIFSLAQKKAQELQKEDHSIQGITLHFSSRSLGRIDVPITLNN